MGWAKAGGSIRLVFLGATHSSLDCLDNSVTAGDRSRYRDGQNVWITRLQTDCVPENPTPTIANEYREPIANDTHRFGAFLRGLSKMAPAQNSYPTTGTSWPRCPIACWN
jgi:hypothetical protein